MNRQLRRAQEKQDKKADKEKAKKRQERRERVQRLRASRQANKSPKARASGGDARKSSGAGAESTAGEPTTTGRPKGRTPGRFAGALALATVFFITLQAANPEPEAGAGQSLVSAAFYLLLGYFAVLWFMRRGVDRALLMTVLGGVVLAASTSVASLLQDRPLDPLLLVLALPALVLGAYLGRLVFVHSPR